MLERERTMRARRKEESGQVLVLFILIMVTCFLIAILAVSVGQVMVRRHQAQAIVDAAAFAGAAKQAEGMNTIARFNEKSLNLLRGIQMNKLVPYMDSNSTTWRRYGESFVAIPAVFFTDDWAGDLLEGYQDIFDVLDDVIGIVNKAYSPLSPIGPRTTADDIIQANFAGSNTVFGPEDLESNGMLMDPARLTDLDNLTKLVKLTERETYEVNGYTYAPNPENFIISTVCGWPFPADEPCLQLLGYYGLVNLYVIIDRFVDPIEYDLGRFYDNDEGTDVRFAYYLKVSQSPVLFGKQFFEDIPPITVAAAAKPYGGYLGDEYESSFFLYSTPDGKEISATYKAKLVPLNLGEKAALPIRLGDFGDPIRWLPVFH
jgi:hypothetical protein